MCRYTNIVYTNIVWKYYILMQTGPTSRLPKSRSTTLYELFRDWLKVIPGRIRARRYRALMNKLRYADAGRKFTREEFNERR